MKTFKQARQKFKSYTDAEKEIDTDGDGIKADELDEAPYVASDSDILDSIWKEVKKVLEKDLKKGKTELTNIIARIAKFKVTKDKQQKGKSFRMDLKRWYHLNHFFLKRVLVFGPISIIKERVESQCVKKEKT